MFRKKAHSYLIKWSRRKCLHSCINKLILLVDQSINCSSKRIKPCSVLVPEMSLICLHYSVSNMIFINRNFYFPKYLIFTCSVCIHTGFFRIKINTAFIIRRPVCPYLNTLAVFMGKYKPWLIFSFNIWKPNFQKSISVCMDCILIFHKH